MIDVDRREDGKIVFSFRNALIIFTLIFIMSGTIHLSGSETGENFNPPAGTAAP